MKIKNIIYKSGLMFASMALLASCSDELDTLPDNRTTLDTPEKVAGLLVTAYPDRTPTLINEWMSDNTDYMGPHTAWATVRATRCSSGWKTRKAATTHRNTSG